MLHSGNTVMSHKCSVLSRKTGKSNVVYYRFRPWERILPGGLSELGVCQEGKVGKRTPDKHLEHGEVLGALWFAVTRSHSAVGMQGKEGEQSQVTLSKKH